MISNELTVTSDSIVDEFARFLSREDILTKRLTLAQISERFTDLYRTLRVSDALFEADGDMLTYGIGVSPEIDQIGLVDARRNNPTS